MLRYHARSVGSRTTCTVRAETTQDGTIHAWMVCICLLGSIQTAVVEMCLIGTRGCALSLSTCRVKFRDTQRASSSQTAAWRIGGSPTTEATSSLRLATACGQYNVSGRLGQPLHCSACFACTRTHFGPRPRTMYRASAFRLQAIRCIMLILTMQDIQERFVLISSISTFCNWIPHCVLNKMPVTCSGPTARLSVIVLGQQLCMHVTP